MTSRAPAKRCVIFLLQARCYVHLLCLRHSEGGHSVNCLFISFNFFFFCKKKKLKCLVVGGALWAFAKPKVFFVIFLFFGPTLKIGIDSRTARKTCFHLKLGGGAAADVINQPRLWDEKEEGMNDEHNTVHMRRSILVLTFIWLISWATTEWRNICFRFLASIVKREHSAVNCLSQSYPPTSAKEIESWIQIGRT